MQASLQQSANSAVSLGKSHGYRFEGDTAILTAELALCASKQDAASGWALQLWACDEPYRGGELRGIKVAEAELALPHVANDAAQLEASASAQLPPTQREYAMVLVLASGAAGVYDQVHDFSNYPLRQGFTGPHLEGNVGYRFVEGRVALQAERIRNPRPESNLSGTLALELWALTAPYEGGSFSGVRLAQAELDPLVGQTNRAAVERFAPLHEPGVGTWQLTMMLREWTAAFGYVTRDYCNFAELYRVVETSTAARSEIASADDGNTNERTSASEPRSEESWSSELVSPAPSVPSPVAQALRQSADAALTMEPPAERSSKVAKAESVATPAPGKLEAAAAPPEASAPRLARVSVQDASIDALAAIPGLNKKLAAAIVRARPFKSLDELTRIRGIGDKILQRLRPYLTL